MSKTKHPQKPKARARTRELALGSRGSASPRVEKRAAAASVSIAPKSKNRPNTKKAQVIAMLRAPGRSTVDAMVRATGWQRHSVRGFLTAVVRKKLGLDLTSRANESGCVYRITERAVSSA